MWFILEFFKNIKIWIGAALGAFATYKIVQYEKEKDEEKKEKQHIEQIKQINDYFRKKEALIEKTNQNTNKKIQEAFKTIEDNSKTHNIDKKEITNETAYNNKQIKKDKDDEEYTIDNLVI